MKVTIENYTSMALRTWCGGNQKERAELGIIGELGEVTEVLKKYLRGDFDKVERDKRLLKEFGDLIYYIAIDMYLNEIDFCRICNDNDYFGNKCKSNLQPNDLCCIISGYLDSRFTSFHAFFLIESFDFFINQDGFTLEQVMQANIDKLASRKMRGKISGDGDNR